MKQSWSISRVFTAAFLAGVVAYGVVRWFPGRVDDPKPQPSAGNAAPQPSIPEAPPPPPALDAVPPLPLPDAKDLIPPAGEPQVPLPDAKNVFAPGAPAAGPATTPAAPLKFEYAVPIPGKPGYVRSPHDAKARPIDIRGLPPGTEIEDPFTPGKSILVP